VFSLRSVPRCNKRDEFGAEVSQSVKRRVEDYYAWELDSWNLEPAGKDFSRGHCYDPLPGND
jgi:hypothetical protein